MTGEARARQIMLALKKSYLQEVALKVSFQSYSLRGGDPYWVVELEGPSNGGFGSGPTFLEALESLAESVLRDMNRRGEWFSEARDRLQKGLARSD